MPNNLPSVTNEFKPMIERNSLAALPPVYNQKKTEMQKKYTIDVHTKIIKLRKDFIPVQETVSERGHLLEQSDGTQ